MSAPSVQLLLKGLLLVAVFALLVVAQGSSQKVRAVVDVEPGTML